MSDPEPTHPNDLQFRPPSPHPFPSEASIKLDTFLGHAIADLSQPSGKIPKMTTASPTGFVPGEISGMFKLLRARKDAMVADLMATGTDVAETIATGEQMTRALKDEGAAMKAEFGLLTNGPPA